MWSDVQRTATVPLVNPAHERFRTAIARGNAGRQQAHVIATDWATFDRCPMIAALRPSDAFYSQRSLDVSDLKWLQRELDAKGVEVFAAHAGAAVRLVHDVNHHPWGAAQERDSTKRYSVLARALTSCARSLQSDLVCLLSPNAERLFKEGIAGELPGIVASQYPSVVEMVGEYRGRALFLKVLQERRDGIRVGHFPSWVPLLKHAADLKSEFIQQFPRRIISDRWLYDSLLDPRTCDWLMPRLHTLIKHHGVAVIDMLWTCRC